MSESHPNDQRSHQVVWKELFNETESLLKDFAYQGLIGLDDFWIVDEDWGWDVLQVELPLSLAWPPLAKKLQSILARYPDWRITIRLSGREQGWPGMGIVISRNNIIDDLKREYFPIQFHNMAFE